MADNVKKRENYLSWDETFMLMARLIAQRSKDPNTQTGAVIVDDNQIIIGMGYNGFPRGIKDETLPWGREGGFLDTKYAYVVHAEENAVFNTNMDTKGCRMYATLFPCNECAKTIIQKGIKEVIYESDPYHEKDAWVASRKLFDEAGVVYKQYVPQNDLVIKPKA